MKVKQIGRQQHKNGYLVSMKKLIIIPFIILLLFSCQNSNKTVENKKVTEIKKDEPYFKPGYHYVQQIPDSLRTPEQQALLKKLAIVTYENLAVKDNKMVFNLSEKEFVAKGIPVEYYELIQKDLVNNNKFIKESNITNMDSILKESNKQIRDSLGL
ncbi:hypothetical protein [Sphingobacterium kitahiroshimense]|uniref:DUF4296 domain-containing protein n=1 Tax=Sphingobacterium kitahiroshimense TaxID=470446 RepID=A0ABV0BVE0_9SPHI